MMRKISIANLAASAVVGSLLFMAPVAAFAGEEVKTAGTVSFMSGGVGDDSLDRMAAATKEFNLKLVFALKSGEFLSDVKVTIVDPAGRTVLDTATEGPWLLARLPQGNYGIVAVSSGNTIRKQVAIGKGGLSTVDFRWPSE